MPNPTVMHIIQKRISLETIIRSSIKFFLNETGFLLHIITTDHKPLRPIFPSEKIIPNPTAMHIIQKRISLETIIRLERKVQAPYFFLMKAGFLPTLFLRPHGERTCQIRQRCILSKNVFH